MIDATGKGAVSISRTRQWSHRCCAQEVALHWSLGRRSDVGHVWIMESDVHFAKDEDFKNFVDAVDESYPGLDLVHQNDKMEQKPMSDQSLAAFKKAKGGKSPWWYRVLYLDKYVTKSAKLSGPYYRGLYQLFRLSRSFLDRLERFYKDNNGSWVFFEPLISTLAGQSTEQGQQGGVSLSSKSFADLARANANANAATNNKRGKKEGSLQQIAPDTKARTGAFELGAHVLMRWRPCVTKDDVDNMGGRGIFHPVKGEFIYCSSKQQFMDVKDDKDDDGILGLEEEEEEEGGGKDRAPDENE